MFVTYLLLMFTCVLIAFTMVQDFGSPQSYGLILIVLVFIGWILKRRNII